MSTGEGGQRTSASRVILGLLLLLVIIGAVLAVVYRDAVWAALKRLVVRPAAAPAPQQTQQQTQQQQDPSETWYAWKDVAERRCILDDTFDDNVRDLPEGIGPALASVDLSGRPSCRAENSSVKRRLVYLQTRSSNRGREQLRMMPCERPEELPECCVPDRRGLNVSDAAAEASDFETKDAAFRALCGARFGCAADPVYAKRLVPWIPNFPLDCFSETNVNTCAYMVLEQNDPNSFSPNPQVLDARTAEELYLICSNDTRRGERTTTPGPSMPRITAEELRTDCLAAGVSPPTSTQCASGGSA
jgi:hypothetical protein